MGVRCKMSEKRHWSLANALILILYVNVSITCVKYHSIDASTAYQQYMNRLQEEANEEYYYDEDDEVQCRPCDEEEQQQPRLFFNIFGDTTRRAPCCEADDTRQAETTTMASGPRMKNATRCGRKYYPRILGGVDTSENEFPWQCAL